MASAGRIYSEIARGDVNKSTSNEIALTTLVNVASTGSEYAALAVKRLRDRNTVARAGARRAALALTLTIADLLDLGATDAEADALPVVDENSRAASVKLVENWHEIDRSDARKPTRSAATIVFASDGLCSMSVSTPPASATMMTVC